jgi:hypothetical protein
LSAKCPPTKARKEDENKYRTIMTVAEASGRSYVSFEEEEAGEEKR